MATNDVFELACQLMSRPSVTPDDAGCQKILADRLAPLGFQIEQIDRQGTSNLWAVRSSHGATDRPHLMFAGHTDVVPTGPEEYWQSPPFTPTVRDNKLYGRGAADMKSSLAAMVVAVERLLEAQPEIPGTISFLITSDEEGDATHGTKYAIEVLNKRGIKPDYCIVGEPSSNTQLGDVVRCGRRGSLSGKLTILGVQGHVAYPDDADNPIHRALPSLLALTSKSWDSGNDYYPPTSLQISNINAGTGATNVIPGTCEIDFNLRFCTEQTSQGLQAAIDQILREHELQYELRWHVSGEPFLTEAGRLTAAVVQAIETQTGITTELSTSGGTSDGRFIAPWGVPGSQQVELVELGPCNATIHKIDECVGLDELEPLSQIYRQIAKVLLKP